MVSVIVPVYNIEEYLRECVESVLAQTYTNLELLLINDGSTDKSGVICDEYALKDSRVRVYHKKNGGLSSARNFGIERSKGNYLIFLDSDDYWIEKNAIKELVSVAKSTGCDIVRGDYKEVNQFGVDRAKNKISSDMYKFSGKICTSGVFFSGPIFRGHFIVLFLIKRDTLNDCRFNEKQKFQEDVEFNIRYFSTPRTCVYLPILFYAYRKRENSITTTPQLHHLKDSFSLCDMYEKYSLISQEKDIIKEYQKQSVLKYLRTLNSMIEAPYYNNLGEVSRTIGLNSIYIKTVKRLIKFKIITKKSVLVFFPPILYIKALHFKVSLYKMLHN